MIRYAILVALFFSLPSAASAYQPDEAMLRDYQGLTKALRANGVDPIAINWRVVQRMCAGLDTETNHISYNQCRFDAALNQVTHSDDRRSCQNDYKRGAVTTNMSVTAINSAVSQNAQNTSYGYSDCMRSLGWRSPNNWQRGRTYYE